MPATSPPFSPPSTVTTTSTDPSSAFRPMSSREENMGILRAFYSFSILLISLLSSLSYVRTQQCRNDHHRQSRCQSPEHSCRDQHRTRSRYVFFFHCTVVCSQTVSIFPVSNNVRNTSQSNNSAAHHTSATHLAPSEVENVYGMYASFSVNTNSLTPFTQLQILFFVLHDALLLIVTLQSMSDT